MDLVLLFVLMVRKLGGRCFKAEFQIPLGK